MILMNGATVFGLDGVEFEVGDYLGSGSFGTVHAAKERAGVQTLAVKYLTTPFADQAALSTFINEGNLAVGIRHPNVIEYVYFHDGTKHKDLPPYILMELADGGTLRDELERATASIKQFSHDELLGMFRQMVAGMKAISAKLVHRDIKPENILISGGVLKISDFGLSKVVEEATRMTTFKGGGTFPYMAPEAWRLEKNTPQLDIYAMGVVFYELATLRLPLQPKTPSPQGWMDAHTFEAVPSPSKCNPALSPKVAQVIVRMIEKSPAKRFGSWEEIEKLLEIAGAPEGATKNPAVAAMIKKRLEADTAAQAARSEADQKAKERQDFCKLVLSQFDQTVLPPLESLIDDFNAEYAGEKASFSQSGGTLGEKMARATLTKTGAQIHFPGGSRIQLSFCVCLEEDFLRDVTIDDFGRRSTRRRVMLPRLKDQRVLGWGLLKASDGRGFNIVLLEEPGDLYGRFVFFVNKMGFPSRATQRPEPFPYEFEELEEEIRLIGAMHIYSTKVQDFDEAFLTTFVSEYA